MEFLFKNVCFDSREHMIQATLDKAGYNFMEPTEENLRECFTDYVACDVWSNLRYDDDDLHEYSVKQICRNFWRLR